MEDNSNSSPKDRMIAILGLTGSGKSTFIERLVGEDVGIGHGLTSRTKTSNLHKFEWRDRRRSRIWLLDTPGFDDTDRNDADVLKDIATILVESSRQYDLAGIIYLHPIVDVRMRGAGQRNLKLLKSICGGAALKHVVLVTTMWEVSPQLQHKYEQRYRDLITSDEWWGNMGDAKKFRHNGSVDTAKNIINEILLQHENHGPFMLQIRDELEDGRNIEDTTAGKLVNSELNELRIKLQGEKSALDQDWRQKLQEKDDEHVLLISKETAKIEEQIRKAEQQQKEMQQNFDDAMQQKTEEYQAALRRVEEERDEANRKIEQLEARNDEILAEREQEKQTFEREKNALEQRIADLTAQDRHAEADGQRMALVKREARYAVTRRQHDQKQTALAEPMMAAESEYRRRDMAYNSRRNIVHVLNVDFLGFHMQWSRRMY